MSVRRRFSRTALLGGLLAMAASAFTVPGEAPGAMVEVLVRPATTMTAATHDVARLGGVVDASHAALELLVARLPEGRLAELAADTDIAGVALDTAVDFAGDTSTTAAAGVTMDLVSRTVRADGFHARGLDGTGVDIALIDTGITEVPALRGRIAPGIDLSFDAGQADFRDIDGYGHGTHLAGIMAGNSADLHGIASGARIVNVKVGDRHGAADVSQVIAGIDWVIQNAHTGGRNIRVINLAFGTPSEQTHTIDPLAFAVEAAWRNGIVVVVSGGNGGTGPGRLANPATHPLILAVGASDTLGTGRRDDDTVASFSQRGTASRSVDLVAPGRSILSVVPADSYLARTNPEAYRGDLFVGSGTSQAAAVTSGAIAVLLQHRPEMTPDDVKFALAKSADSLVDGTVADGAGLFDLRDARKHSAKVAQRVASSNGSGSLEASRGGNHVELVMDDGSIVTLEAEVDFTGANWTGKAWAGDNWTGSNWDGANWNGSNWNGANWSGSKWNGANWSGSKWNGANWSGANWSGSIWGS